MSASPLPRLRTYWFVHQHVEALAQHDRGGRLDGTQVETTINFNRQVEQGAVAVDLTLRTLDEVSANPPYKFLLHVVGRFDDPDPKADLPSQFMLAIVSMLVGAARERLMEMTSRSPFGAFALQPIQIDPENLPPAPPRPPETAASDAA